MASITIIEVLRATLLSLVLGWLFADMIPPLLGTWNRRFWLALVSVAPAVILHELAHKLVGIMFGLSAELYVPWIFILLAIILKLARSPFIFIVPAFVSLQGPLTPLSSTLTALAGPAMNLLLAFLFWRAEHAEALSRAPYETLLVLHVSMQINLFLGIFNLIPIPGFDGSKVFFGLLQLLSGGV